MQFIQLSSLLQVRDRESDDLVSDQGLRTNHLVPQFPLILNKTNSSTCHIELFCGLNESVHVKHLEKCLAYENAQ